ncbi:UDP-N-acetylglucosamine-N-acetylmuramylpentapeptide N-acetylglucosamine transferase [Methylobacillus rhizosphaerae]|uniref:UDP-N-acetylglucosamine--N-acetylmuramyl-(pentapeptide) pyrophosphoryl-undecaprenol N-acetylglucosamine transferase n=1 Tax=Methylobacillus rhizosphaerae TaxID=551994 RepID=A0A238XZ03_9PROT|nr:undecaprenyldiphospho-muramoylpentapeptide beta-N-acetylglucosaminyltransferase [Methylobacillus rhizosphaerae]SNR63952.1 UDP-N-acetylglucosamine-N-acetylmuramylpentapeptide N-acetylglucosamine transferase [Methylobacillus rhizosphaerae]
MSKTLLIMAAGTGGHVMPGLAIAETMRARGWDVHWLGTAHGMENRLVPPHGFQMTQLQFSGLRGKGWKHSVAGVFRLVTATFSAWRLMGRLKPQIVLGMGGYVTVPGGWAARVRGLPLALVNADAALLMSNQALVQHAKRILFGFEGGMDALGKLAFKARVTGNPVREEIVRVAAPEQRFAGRTGTLHLLVVGGSLGAQVLNAMLPKALALLPAEDRPVVTHQSGAQHIEALRQAYVDAGVQADVVPFIDDMADAYARADVLVCRAGAITVSELAAAGVASILVPLVVSTTSHQRDNARWMAEHNAAIHLPQQEMTPQVLASLLQELTRNRLLAMAHAARELGRPRATEIIANELESIALPARGGSYS